MVDFAYNGTFTRYSLFVPFQTSINVTETNELFAPINKSPLTNDPSLRAPGPFPRAGGAARGEGEAPGGAVTHGASSARTASCRGSAQHICSFGSLNLLMRMSWDRRGDRAPLSAIVTLSWGAAPGPRRHPAAARCQATATSRCEMAPLPARGNPTPTQKPRCHWSPAWPISSPGAFPRPCAPAFKQSASRPALPLGWAGSGCRLVLGAVNQRGWGRFWPPIGAPGCQSAAAGAGRAWCGRAACPPRRWLWRAGGPGASGGYRCSGRALLLSPALQAPRELHWITAASAPPASERAEVAAAELASHPWSCSRPVQVRLSKLRLSGLRLSGPAAALAAVPSRPAAFAPGAGAALRKGDRAGGRVRPMRVGEGGAQSLWERGQGHYRSCSEASCQLSWRVSLNSSGKESPLNVVKWLLTWK